MNATSRIPLLVGLLAAVSMAAFFGEGAGSAKAQGLSRYQTPPSYAYAAAPLVSEGSVVLNGEIVGRDPDPNVRASLLREHRLYDRGGQ